MSKAHFTLGLPVGCGVTELKAQWRQLAKAHHPDSNPDANPVDFTTYRNAYIKALKYEEDLEKICPKCEGTGKVPVGRGFNKLLMKCPQCGGV